MNANRLATITCFLDDVRHDVYLTLMSGMFNKGTKRADKNVEIDVDILDDRDVVIPVSTVLCALTHTHSHRHALTHTHRCTHLRLVYNTTLA